MAKLNQLLTSSEIECINTVNKNGTTEMNYNLDIDLLTWSELRLVGFAFFEKGQSINLAIKAIEVLTQRAIEKNIAIFNS